MGVEGIVTKCDKGDGVNHMTSFMGDPRETTYVTGCTYSAAYNISPQVTTLDKLFTRVPLSPSITSYQSKSGDAVPCGWADD